MTADCFVKYPGGCVAQGVAQALQLISHCQFPDICREIFFKKKDETFYVKLLYIYNNMICFSYENTQAIQPNRGAPQREGHDSQATGGED